MRTRELAAIGTIAIATSIASGISAPAEAHAQEAAEPGSAAPKAPKADASYEVVSRNPPSSARWKILVAGIGLTAVGYAGSALMGGLWEGVPGGDFLFIPVAGPWIALGKSGCVPEEESSTGAGDCGGMMALRGVIYVVDALVQLGGLGIVGESIFMTTESPDAAPKAAVLPMPIVTEHTIGLGVVGTF